MLSTFLNDFYKLLLKKYITFIFLWGKELVFDRFLIEKLVSIEITIKLHSVTHRSFNLYMYNTHTYVQDNTVSEHVLVSKFNCGKKNHYVSVLSGTARKKKVLSASTVSPDVRILYEIELLPINFKYCFDSQHLMYLWWFILCLC